VLLAALALAPATSAELVSGHPDESIQQAYPISPGILYQGAFDNTLYNDVDYLAFTVANPGETLAFAIANTTQVCNDPNDAGCPVYATLMDRTDNQVGGPASAAGTIATFADTELFDWTFSQAGTYYLLMESNGDEAPGNPSYAVRFGVVSPGGGGGRGGGGKTLPSLVRALRVLPVQHGPVIKGTLTLGQPAIAVKASLLLARTGRTIVSLSRKPVSAGRHRLKFRLPTRYRHLLSTRGRLSVIFRITARGPSGASRTLSRHVTVER
jgi:hypothetical protein